MSTDLQCPQCCWMFRIYLGDTEGPYICCLCLRIYTFFNVVGCSISTLGTVKVHLCCLSLRIYTVLNVPQCSISTFRPVKVHICCLCLRIYTILNVVQCSISTLGTVKVHIYVMFTDLHCPQCCWMFNIYMYLGDSEGPYIYVVLCLQIYTVPNVLQCSISTLGTVKVHIYCFISTDLHCPQCSRMFNIYLGDNEGPYIFCLCL